MPLPSCGAEVLLPGHCGFIHGVFSSPPGSSEMLVTLKMILSSSRCCCQVPLSQGLKALAKRSCLCLAALLGSQTGAACMKLVELYIFGGTL